MTHRPDDIQLDLFAWADKRPTAIILDAIPRIAKRMWKEVHEPRVERVGTLINFPPNQTPQMRKIA